MKMKTLMKKAGTMMLLFVAALMLSVVVSKTDSQAASQPYLFADEIEMVACCGEVAEIKFTYFPAYKQEKIHVRVYNSDGDEVAASDKQFYNSSTTQIEYTVTWDTGDYKPGRYKVVASMEFYSWNQWNEKASVSTSYIQLDEHNYSTSVSKKATMSEAGKATYTCSVCGDTYTEVVPKIASVELKKTAFTYNGEKRGPSVIVKDNKGKVLTKGTDYTVKYADGRTKVGSYKVVVTFKGAYKGAKTLWFRINPKVPTVKSLTAEKKNFTFKWSKVTGATGYEIQYATNKGFTANKKTVTISSGSTVSKKITGLKASKEYYVRVRAVKKIGEKVFKSDWSKVKSITTKSDYKISASKKTLLAGATYELKLTNSKGKKIDASKITFSSDKTGVAKVSKKGVITAKKPGTAVISAKYNGQTLKCKVIVNSRLVVANNNLNMNIDGTKSVKITKKSSVSTMTFHIEDTSIVRCEWGSWSGDSIPLKITAKDVGTTRIKITHDGKGSANDVQYITVTVKPNFTLKCNQKVPLEVKTYSYNDIVRTRGEIQSIDIEYEDNKAIVTLKGVLTKNDDEDDELIFGYEVYDSEGYVVDTGYIFTDITKEGQKFKIEEDIYFWDEKGNFKLVFVDYD